MANFSRYILSGGVCAALLSMSPLAADQAVAEKSKVIPPQLFFSPQDEVDKRLIAMIENEKEDIRAAIYCLTHREVIQALMDARKRGVNVEIVVDPFSIKAKSPLKRMAQAGIALYIWDPEPLPRALPSPVPLPASKSETKKDRKPLMHNKFCIFGQKTVWTGSFNFTSEASKANQENVVVLHDPAIAQRYGVEFERVKNEGCSTFSTYLSNKSTKKKKTKLL